LRFFHHFLRQTLSVLRVLATALSSLLKSQMALQVENLALRHQIGVLKRSAKGRPQLTVVDRGLWVWLCSVWRDWRSALVIVKPETVVAWHRKGFRLFWTWKVRHGKPGRPKVPKETRELIRRMSLENPMWGAPRIHGELLTLGIDIGETSVNKYMVRQRKPPSQTWRTFLDTWDAAPRYLLRDRDRIFGDDFTKQVQDMDINEVLSTPRAPWQRAYVERLIGTIRRECLDHLIVFNEASLCRHLKSFVAYYHQTRTHLGLDKDTPESRPVQPPDLGPVIAIPQVGGLHHRYERRAA
jgi:putative transposase